MRVTLLVEQTKRGSVFFKKKQITFTVASRYIGLPRPPPSPVTTMRDKGRPESHCSLGKPDSSGQIQKETGKGGWPGQARP